MRLHQNYKHIHNYVIGRPLIIIIIIIISRYLLPKSTQWFMKFQLINYFWLLPEF